MTRTPFRPLGALLLLLTLAPILLTLAPTAALAERAVGPAAALDASYQIGDGGLAADGQGPVRLARFSYARGNVTWRLGEGASWSAASVNLPLRQGAQIWVADGGRAEVQFDDGALLRLGSGAIVTLQTLYSDAEGEYTELQMSEGVSALRLKHGASIYQVDTPFASVKAEGPAKVRIGVGDSVEVAAQGGSAAVEGSGQKAILRAGDYLDLPDAQAPYRVGLLPDPDGWDAWNDARDRQLADADSAAYLPPSIGLVAGDLGDYGAWRDDPQYGHVWCPRHADGDWRPYEHGRWTWVDPFGWTWVSSEDWGWAPYHYGTWVEASYGWAWVPGPARQYWCPAVVHFSEYNGAVAWCPLAPREVRYPPALSVGLHTRGFSLNFSIGGCAVYYPAGATYCAPRPFSNVLVNRAVYVHRVTNVYNTTNVYNNSVNNATLNRNLFVHNGNTYLTDGRFVPQNARAAAGVTTASVTAFGGGGAYQPQPRGAATFFARGRGIGAPQPGAAPVAGPVAARPTAQSFTPSRTFLAASRPPREFTQRPLFRGSLPARVARFAPPLPHPQAALLRPAARPSRTQTLRTQTPGTQTPGTQTLRQQPFQRPGGSPRPFGEENGAQQRARAARRSFGPTGPRPHDVRGPRPGATFGQEQPRPAQGRPGTFDSSSAGTRLRRDSQPSQRRPNGGAPGRPSEVRRPQGDSNIQDRQRPVTTGEPARPAPRPSRDSEAARTDTRQQSRPAPVSRPAPNDNRGGDRSTGPRGR